MQQQDNNGVRIIVLTGEGPLDRAEVDALAALLCAADKGVKAVVAREAQVRKVPEVDFKKAIEELLARQLPLLPLPQGAAGPRPRKKFPHPPRRL